MSTRDPFRESLEPDGGDRGHYSEIDLGGRASAPEQPARDPAVRELAEEVVESVLLADGGKGPVKWPVRAVEERLRAFLAEQEAAQAGALAALRGALERAERAVKERLDTEYEVPGDREDLSTYRAALAPGAGRAEAEVIRAAPDAIRAAENLLALLPGLEEEVAAAYAEKIGAARLAVDALRAARGGEGEAP